MSKYVIKDSQVLQKAVTINADGSNTYNTWTWVALATNTFSPSVEFVSESGQPSTVQVSVVGTNATNTTVDIQGSLDDVNWAPIGTTITVAGANGNTVVTVAQTWQYIRARITTVSAATTVSVTFRV